MKNITFVLLLFFHVLMLKWSLTSINVCLNFRGPLSTDNYATRKSCASAGIVELNNSWLEVAMASRDGLDVLDISILQYER